MDSLPTSVRIVDRDGRNVVAVWENLVLAVWGESPSLRSMEAIHESHLEVLQRRSTVAHLVLVDGTPKMPTSEARDHASRYSSRSKMSAIAIVLDGEGFWMSAARAFLTTVLFVTRNDAPTKLFARVEDAVAWQTTTLSQTSEYAEQAQAAIAGLRAFSVDLEASRHPQRGDP